MSETNNNSEKNLLNPDNGIALSEALDELLGNLPASRSISLEENLTNTLTISPSCPETEEFFSVMEGLSTEPKRLEFLNHASLCGHCAKLLQQSIYINDLELDADDTELQAIATFLTPEWQDSLAARLSQTPTLKKPSNARKDFTLIWAIMASAATIVLAATLGIWWQARNAPSRLLAEAYSVQRTSDMRLPGATFANVSPFTHTRGASSQSLPESFARAQSRIEEKLGAHPNDAVLLQLQARAQYMQGNFTPAIAILDSLLTKGSSSTSVLLDDASAYYQRGLISGSANDLNTALDDLRRADELNPTDPVILFNEAIIQEDCKEYMNAVETWNRFMKFEKDPQWRAEGQKRLHSLETKLRTN